MTMTQKELAKRIATEKRIVGKTIRALKKAGFLFRVDDGGDDMSPMLTRVNEVLDLCFGTDCVTVFVYVGLREAGWVNFVYGNGGWDVLSDYTTNLEDVLKPVNDFADSLA
jgi:hypothetical protein